MKLINFSPKNTLIIVCTIFVVIFPFLNESSDNIYPALEINDSSVGYYQSTTCNISLLNVAKVNLNNDLKIKYNNNNYPGIECFGKVTGLDKVNNVYIISIGTTSNITLLMQTLIWSLIIFSFSKNKIRFYNIKFLNIFILSLFFTFQQFSEERFYSQMNKYFDLTISINNFYLVNLFLSFYISLMLISAVVEHYESSLVSYFPYLFLIVGAFNGFNLNFFSILLSYIGLKSLLENKFNKKVNLLYILFSFAWMQTRRENNSYFDTDKLNGFINSSNNFYSLLFWVILFLLILNGFIYIYRQSNFDLKKISFNLLISSNLIVLIGLLGAVSPLQNFFNYIIFGQNKRGINSLSSVDGNTWRGFSSSAESIGEFYGFVLLFSLIIIYYKKVDFNYSILFFLILPVYGLFKSNNFAATISLFSIGLLIFVVKYLKNLQKRNLILISLIFLIFGPYLLINKLGLEYASTQLLYEASLNSNFFSYLDKEAKFMEITRYFNSGAIDSLINDKNKNNGSTLLAYLSNLYLQSNFNIPLVPNVVTIISFVSIIINRSEMWGIFIAKYNPNFIEAIFGNGPYQLNNYLYNLKIDLDVPYEKLSSLFLPHSSILDIFVFFGILGLLVFLLWNFYLLITKSSSPEYKFLLIFLLLNLSKSDSLMYLNSLVMLSFVYMIIFKAKVVEDE